MDPFKFLSTHFWAIALAVAAVNYWRADRSLLSLGLTKPGQLDEARRYLRIFALGSVVPWLVMGWSIVTGGVPGIWHYFRPQDGNPHVIAWFASIIAMTLIYAIWVFAADGAHKIREFGLLGALGMPSEKPIAEWLIKLWAAVGPFFVVLWIFLAASMDAPVPK